MMEKLLSKNRVMDDLRKRNFHKVPSYIFSSSEVYELEVEKIFAKCWLYLGHVSEIPENGDYVTRSMGETPVIVSRTSDGNIEALLNVCTHRGMKLCRTDCGNSAHFRCIYHGYTFKNNGDLIGVPFQKLAYGPEMEKGKFGLKKAKVSIYKGLIFGTWNQNPQPLEEYLGNMSWYLDLIAGRAEMEVVGPPQRFEVEANWKLAAENFASDAYHTGTTHGSIVELGLAAKPNFANYGHHITAGNGHGLGIGTGVPGSPDILPAEVDCEYEANLSGSQYKLLKDLRNLHATVFPNFSILFPTVKVDNQPVSVITLRLWQPKGPTRIEIFSWFLVEKNANPEWKAKSHKGYIFSFGTSGIFEQDDTENWFEITDMARKMTGVIDFEYNANMGINKPPIHSDDFPGPGEAIYEGKYNEANSRSFYKHWRNLIVSETE